ncbi:MAG: hypothetical protein NXI22_22705, partial [bacterium]|nr:hypothetical protein [bacterium]
GSLSLSHNQNPNHNRMIHSASAGDLIWLVIRLVQTHLPQIRLGAWRLGRPTSLSRRFPLQLNSRQQATPT